MKSLWFCMIWVDTGELEPTALFTQDIQDTQNKENEEKNIFKNVDYFTKFFHLYSQEWIFHSSWEQIFHSPAWLTLVMKTTVANSKKNI